MMDPLFLISLLVFLGVLVVGWGAWSYMQSQEKVKDWSIRAKGQSLSQSSSQKSEKKTSLKDQGMKLLERLGQVNKPKDQAVTTRLRASLATAGYRNPRAIVVFLGTRIFLAVLLGLTFLVFGSEVMQGKDPMFFPIVLIGVMMVGFYGPQLWLSSAITKR
ncbi:MAG: hypothetical protein ABI618_19380, partial [Nitrospirota bacterium]